MEYFVMRQDSQMTNVVKTGNWQQVSMMHRVIHRLAMPTSKTKILYAAAAMEPEYPDFLERPVPLIAEKLKNIVSLYQEAIQFETVVLIEKQAGRQTVYYRMDVPEIDAASEQSRRYLGKITDLVLERGKVGNQKIFRIAGDSSRVIVRLDVAESILRRGTYGIIFEQVKMI